MKNTIDDTIRRKIINVIKAVIPRAKIILYGSRARKTHHEHSDIDIALDAGQKLDRLTVGEIRDMLNASHIIQKIDVVDLYALSEDMRKTIVKEGIIWND